MQDSRWIDQAEIKSSGSLLGHMAGGRIAVYAKKFEIFQKETYNSALLSDCVPVIMDLITCDLEMDKTLRETVLRSLVQMVVSSEKVVKEMSAVWKTDVLMKDLLHVMRAHVMTQYKHYQLYTHNMITVMKSLASVMKNSKAKEYEYIQTTYQVGKDNCTVLDVLMKPVQYLVNMNRMFNDLGCMLLDDQDTNYVSEIKRYLTQVFNKIQSKLDLMSHIIDEIFNRYESRCHKKMSDDKKWMKFKEQLKRIFATAVVTPCEFTVNLYLNYYFPSEKQIDEFLNAAGNENKCIILSKINILL